MFTVLCKIHAREGQTLLSTLVNMKQNLTLSSLFCYIHAREGQTLLFMLTFLKQNNIGNNIELRFKNTKNKKL
jgi:hypothetical protein